MAGYGYGYSIWCVPINYEVLRARFEMQHIPHVTIETHIPSEKKARERMGRYDSSYKIEFENDVHDLSHITYTDKDTLRARGFYCTLQGLDLPHQAHMTLFYDAEKSRSVTPPLAVEGEVVLADTRAADPAEWLLLY